jgi:CHAT domain-containing protein/tetratricopeptide (TPR) repeat protein
LVASSLNNLALLYKNQGRYSEAEPLYKRSLAIREKALGLDHADTATALNNLGTLYRAQGRFGEAEPLYQRSLGIKEKTLGLDHPSVGTSLSNLALLYDSQGRYGEAEPLYKRSVAIYEKALGPDHPSVGPALNNLALLYWAQGRYGEAEPLYKRTVAIYEKARGPDHTSVGTALNNLAEVYESQGRTTEAEPLYKRSLTIHEKALGPDQPNVALNNLAAMYDRQGRYAEAEPLYKRDLAIREKALGPDHPTVGTSLSNLAGLYFAQREWSRAAENWRRSTALVARRSLRGTPDLGQSLVGKRKSEADQARYQFWGFAKATFRVAAQDGRAKPSLEREMFRTAQWAEGSEAAASLAQMAARGAKGDAGLSLLVRERQDLVAEWQKRDGVRTAALSQAPDKRDRPVEANNVARLAAIDARITEIDKRLVSDFPDYAALNRPDPLTVEEVQSQIRPDEALVLFLDTPEWKPTPEETFTWIITKTDVRWVKSDLGTPALTREVAALRCGLDLTLWDDDRASGHCRDLLKTAPQRDRFDTVISATLPFDTARAHGLYRALFDGVEDLIRDKHLLIVPSGPLTQLPFQVLVTTPATASGDYKSTAWLARTHAITVLPAVSSLKALRRVGRPSAATKPMIGFGNPLLDGNPRERPWESQWAALARDKACNGLPLQWVTEATHKTRGVLRVARRDGHADLADVRSLMPLPDTADELCGVAKDLKLSPDDIWLGARATETNIKALSDQGKLAQYHVLHLATHGTLAGDISGSSEPGLIFTPPKEATGLDDGYLSASEVAALKLDADWVILSACNTAAGGAQGAEALSGLARAFIYAGARALLVSHWSVDSAATVKLVTSAVGATARDKTIGRAEALRRAMLEMIDTGEGRQMHPAYWAPFVVVGEGTAAK